MGCLTHTLTPHKAAINKFVVVLRRLGCTGFTIPGAIRDPGHLNAGFLKQAKHTGWSLTFKLHGKVTPIYRVASNTVLGIHNSAEEEHVQVYKYGYYLDSLQQFW